MECSYQPYFDPDYDSLIERIHPPRVCIDNDTREDCTLVKVDSVNKHGILLEMVQVLTDLDLVISKSYISSDGGWFMDVFHVTDQLGNKLTDETLIHYIQQSLGKKRRNKTEESRTCLGRKVGHRHDPSEHTILEMTGIDRPGLLSEISAVLASLNCQVSMAKAWTHNKHAACIFYMADETDGRPIFERERLAHVEEQLEMVVDAHCETTGEKRRVKVSGPMEGRTHTDRRLHQLMLEDRDYESHSGRIPGGAAAAQVSIENCNEKGYSVVTVRSRDRPKLLFDTVCTLTDMDYVVSHAAISSHGTVAVQEYYIRHMDGCTLNSESERRRIQNCLIAAVERRVSHGLRLDLCTRNKVGLLSDVTRVFRENGLSVTRAEISTRGERAIGTFYVTDASGNDVDPKIVDSVKAEIGCTVVEAKDSPAWTLLKPKSTGSVEKPRSSLSSLFWSRLERLSTFSNLGFS